VIDERAVTTLAFPHPVDHRVIGRFDHLERIPHMSGLSAGW